MAPYLARSPRGVATLALLAWALAAAVVAQGWPTHSAGPAGTAYPLQPPPPTEWRPRPRRPATVAHADGPTGDAPDAPARAAEADTVADDTVDSVRDPRGLPSAAFMLQQQLQLVLDSGARGPQCHFKFPTKPADALYYANDAAAFSVADMFVFLGASGANTSAGTGFLFNLTACAWRLFPTPIPYVAATSTLLPSGQVLVVGGGYKGAHGTQPHCLPKAPECMVATTWLLHPTTLTFAALPPAPTPVSYHAAAAYGHLVFIVGGIQPAGLSSSVMTFDWVRQTWSTGQYPDLPGPISGAAAVTMGSTLYVYGGQAPNAEGYTAQLVSMDLTQAPAQAAWVVKSAMRRARAFFGFAAVACHLYAIGGTDSANGAGNEAFKAEVYDPYEDAWYPAANLTTTLSHFSAAFAPSWGQILIAGGESGPDGSVPVAFAQQYSLCRPGQTGYACYSNATQCQQGFVPGTHGACLPCMGTVASGDTCIPACNGHGTCSGDGTCTCQPFFAQPACAECVVGRTGPTCTACAPGYWGPDCTACPGLQSTGLICSGHGLCSGSNTTSGDGKCICNMGWAGHECSECDSGYYGPQCLPCFGSPYAPCDNHGFCSDGLHGNGSCTCLPEFVQPNCTACRINIGGSCAKCPEGFWGEDCELCPGAILMPSGTVTNICSGHGSCSGSGSSDGDGSCTCATGWTLSDCSACALGYGGPDCSQCAGSHPNSNLFPFSSCNYHGTCDAAAANCTCSGTWTGPTCCEATQCPPGWSVPLIAVSHLILLVAISLIVRTSGKEFIVVGWFYLQFAALFAQVSGLRAFSVLSGIGGGVSYVDVSISSLPPLRWALEVLALLVNMDYTGFASWRFCSDPLFAYGILWSLPFMIPAAGALFLLVLLSVRHWILRNLRLRLTSSHAYDAMITMYFLSFGGIISKAAESFWCSSSNQCDPTSSPFTCDLPAGFGFTLVGVVIFIVAAIVIPVILARTFGRRGEGEHVPMQNASNVGSRELTVIAENSNSLIGRKWKPFIRKLFRDRRGFRLAVLLMMRALLIASIVIFENWLVALLVMLGLWLTWAFLRDVLHVYSARIVELSDRILWAAQLVIAIPAFLVSRQLTIVPIFGEPNYGYDLSSLSVCVACLCAGLGLTVLGVAFTLFGFVKPCAAGNNAAREPLLSQPALEQPPTGAGNSDSVAHSTLLPKRKSRESNTYGSGHGAPAPMSNDGRSGEGRKNRRQKQAGSRSSGGVVSNDVEAALPPYVPSVAINPSHSAYSRGGRPTFDVYAGSDTTTGDMYAPAVPQNFHIGGTSSDLIAVKYCAQCGTCMESTMNFCPTCGHASAT